MGSQQKKNFEKPVWLLKAMKTILHIGLTRNQPPTSQMLLKGRTTRLDVSRQFEQLEGSEAASSALSASASSSIFVNALRPSSTESQGVCETT